jgi:hypothetical protein
MPDGPPPLALPELPATVARPLRRGATEDPWRARAAWLVLAAHVAGLLAVDRALRLRDGPPPAPVPGRETVVEIRFLPPDPVAPAPAPAPAIATTPASTAPRAAPDRRPTAPPPQRDDGMAARFLPATPEPSIDTRRLFDPNGAVRLPEGLVERDAPAARDPLAAPASPLPFERTRFDRAWRPNGETLAQQAVRTVPLLGIVLPGAFEGPNCPPNSTDIRCEAAVQEQRARIPPTPQSGKQPW